jgi:hypothetical protein
MLLNKRFLRGRILFEKLPIFRQKGDAQFLKQNGTYLGVRVLKVQNLIGKA